MVGRALAVVAVAMALAGCAAAPPASTPAPAVGSTAPPTPPPTAAPSGAPASSAPSPAATASPTPAPVPPLFDSAAFLKVLDWTDGSDVLKQYPAVSGAKVMSLYAAAVKADPALGKALGNEKASANPSKSAPAVQICAGKAPNPDGVTFSQVEDYQEACADALPRLIWYANHNRDAKALPLLRALIGYILREGIPLMGTPWSDAGSQGWRAWMVARTRMYADFLDGRCGGPAGLGSC